MSFRHLWVLFLIPLLLGTVIWIKRRQKASAFFFPSLTLVSSLSASWKIQLRRFPDVLRLIVLILFLTALAGPQKILEETTYKAEGIDIVLAIDASGSMAAEDFEMEGRRYNRLTVVKDVVKEFVHGRQHDRISLVAFAALAYTVCPLTTDYEWLTTNLERVELGMIEDGTAVGSAITSSAARLKNSKAKSKVVILLTDGMSNAGKIEPIPAAQAAQALGIKIYTVAAGSKGYVPFPAIDPWGRRVYQKVLIDMDEDTLRTIAELTGGKYFHASDTNSLRQIYREIDAFEKTEIEEHGYRRHEELFGWFLAAGLIVLFAEILLARTVLLKAP